MAPNSFFRQLLPKKHKGVPKEFMPPSIPLRASSFGHKETLDPQEIGKIRNACSQFRILIVGRANSGKTTIIQRICDTNDDPIVHDENGKEYPASVLKMPNAMRGIHNINLQITFANNPGFIFHDSMGFESGSTGEVENVKDFIQKKLAESELRNRLHAIWFCVPTDSNRVAFEAELSFFKEKTGDIPVILVFTKWDGRIVDACNELIYDHDMELAKAMKKAPKHALQVLEREYIPVFKNTPYPPAAYTVLGYMDQPDTKCDDLSKKTAAALNDGTLKKLFVSVQTHNLELCAKEIFETYLTSENASNHESTITSIACWFGHVYRDWIDYSVSVDFVYLLLKGLTLVE